MMSTENRIRYSKVGDGVYRSVRRYDGLLVILYTEERRFKIVDDMNTTVAEGKVLGGPHKIKKAAKKALSNLGIKFSKEKRNKGNDNDRLFHSNGSGTANGQSHTDNT